jgi:hypothetical protein
MMYRFAKTAGALSTGLLLISSTPQPLQANPPRGIQTIKVASGQILYEIIGEGFNLIPPNSAQIGYFTYIKGVDTLFSGTPENASTALFTYYKDTVDVQVTVHGPLRIVSRQGTTTVYLNPTPSADLSNPDTFRAGTAIQVSTFRQQAIIDTLAQTFTIVDEDTITSSSVFSINGEKFKIGKEGDVYRTIRSGHLNTPGSFLAGWLAGYSVGADSADKAGKSESDD